jgi:probable rRNA maturation factor|tara:strand:- start:265 stop:717 length:453 start_codon:yes stop_codon:yes gene_type:complete
MIKINVLVENNAWKKYFKNPNNYLLRKSKILSKKNVLFSKHNCNFSLLLTGSKEIKKLNRRFRKKNKITDVLSFPFHNKKILPKILKKNENIYLGDVAVNIYKINKENFKVEFDKLWLHGLLHLIGYTHKINKDYHKMLRLENNLLNIIN